MLKINKQRPERTEKRAVKFIEKLKLRYGIYKIFQESQAKIKKYIKQVYVQNVKTVRRKKKESKKLMEGELKQKNTDINKQTKKQQL